MARVPCASGPSGRPIGTGTGARAPTTTRCVSIDEDPSTGRFRLTRPTPREEPMHLPAGLVRTPAAVRQDERLTAAPIACDLLEILIVERVLGEQVGDLRRRCLRGGCGRPAGCGRHTEGE